MKTQISMIRDLKQKDLKLHLYNTLEVIALPVCNLMCHPLINDPDTLCLKLTYG